MVIKSKTSIRIIQVSACHFIFTIVFGVLLGFMALGFGFSDNNLAKSTLGIAFYALWLIDLPASWVYHGLKITDWRFLVAQIITSLLWGSLLVKGWQWYTSKA